MEAPNMEQMPVAVNDNNPIFRDRRAVGSVKFNS